MPLRDENGPRTRSTLPKCPGRRQPLYTAEDLKSADFELRRTADLDVAYLTQALDLVWRFYEDPDRIMTTHVPNTHDANLTALNYFITQKSEKGAALAWSKLKTFETTPQERFSYIHYLIASGKPHEAWAVFLHPQPAGETGREAAGEGGQASNLLFNPSFEIEPMNGAFDWRFSSTEHSEARRDTTTAKDGYIFVARLFRRQERMWTTPAWLTGVPRPRASRTTNVWMKTEGISTNEGVYVDVDGHLFDKQVGTTYWRQFTIPFVANADLVDNYTPPDSFPEIRQSSQGQSLGRRAFRCDPLIDVMVCSRDR
jgi:hypothetical protein